MLLNLWDFIAVYHAGKGPGYSSINLVKENSSPIALFQSNPHRFNKEYFFHYRKCKLKIVTLLKGVCNYALKIAVVAAFFLWFFLKSHNSSSAENEKTRVK